MSLFQRMPASCETLLLARSCEFHATAKDGTAPRQMTDVLLNQHAMTHGGYLAELQTGVCDWILPLYARGL